MGTPAKENSLCKGPVAGGAWHRKPKKAHVAGAKGGVS